MRRPAGSRAPDAARALSVATRGLGAAALFMWSAAGAAQASPALAAASPMGDRVASVAAATVVLCALVCVGALRHVVVRGRRKGDRKR